MPYTTLTEKSKATIKPWFSRILRHLARKRSGSILVHKTDTYLLTYLLAPDPQGANELYIRYRVYRSLDL